MQPEVILKLHQVTDACLTGESFRGTRRTLHRIIDELEAEGLGAETVPTLKSPISAAAKARMGEVKEALAHEPVEHAIIWGIKADGSLGFEVSYTEGRHNRVQPRWADIVAQARLHECAGICATHNHPVGTSPDWSDEDSLATSQLAAYLKEHQLTLLLCDHVAASREARQCQPASEIPTLWAVRQAQDDEEPAYLRAMRARLEGMRGGR